MNRAGRRRRSRSAGLAAALGLLLSAPAPFAGALPGSGPTPDVGIVDTVAGPGFCDGPAVLDRDSTAVGSLAVTSAGAVWFDVGAPSAGLVGRADERGIVRVVGTEVKVGPDPADPAAPRSGGVPSASRLAADADTGVLAAAGDRVVRVLQQAVTVAGGAPGGSDGDGVALAAARFRGIRSLTTDPAGNVFLADDLDPLAGTVRIRFLNRSAGAVTFYAGTPLQVVVAPGTVSTIAGAAGPTAAGDGGSARDAVFQGVPPAMAVAGGVLYLASTWPLQPSTQVRTGIRAVNLGGTPLTALGVAVAPAAVQTVAGGAAGGFSGDGGPARSAAFGYIAGIASDGANLYLADVSSHRIRRIDKGGIVATFAGTGGVGPADGGFDGNERPAVAARLNRPYDVKLGPGGRVYISDRGNGQVRFVDPAGTIHAAPSQGLGLGTRCLQPAPDRSRGANPQAVATDGRGGIYFTGGALPQVKKLDPTGLVSTVAGVRNDVVCGPGPPGCPPNDGMPATAAQFYDASALAAGAGEGIYVYDAGHRRVRYMNLGRADITVHGVRVRAGTVETVAGSGAVGDGGDGGPAVSAQISDVGALAVTLDGNLFISDIGNLRLRRVDPAGTITAVDVCCGSPRGVAVDPAGNLYLADAGRSQVWFLNRGSAPVTAHGQTVAPGAAVAVAGDGSGGVGGDGGPATKAQFDRLSAIAVDGRGNLYIADNNVDHTIRRVDPAGTASTVVGTGTFGFNGDGLDGNLTVLNEPVGLAVDPCGNVLIADSRNGRIRRYVVVPTCEAASPPPVDSTGGGLPPVMIAGAAALAALGAGAGLLVRRRGGRNR